VRFVASLVLVVSLGACGKTVVEHASVPPETSTTTTTTPYDGRLHVAVVPESYAEDSDALSSWRMDPAPADMQSTLTLDEVRTSFEKSDFGRNQQPRYYFGLFTGNEPNPNAPDGRLTGVHRVENVPAWLVMIDNREIPLYGSHDNAPPEHGWAWTQLYDRPGASPISGEEDTGGQPPPVY
jgi:hypothetical protein